MGAEILAGTTSSTCGVPTPAVAGAASSSARSPNRETRYASLRSLPPAAGLSGIVAAGEVPVPTEDQAWYYTIGGAEPVSIALNPAGAHQVLDAHASLTASYSCGNFDIVSSVTNSFSNAATSLQSTVMGAARGAIAALPPVRLSAGRAGSV